MWHRRWTLATLLFFLNRYVLIALVPLTFIDASTSAVSSTRSIVGSVSDLSFQGSVRLLFLYRQHDIDCIISSCYIYTVWQDILWISEYIIYARRLLHMLQ